MKVYETDKLDIGSMNSDELLWIYNGHDVLLPMEIFFKVLSRMNANQLRIYGFEKALQGPAVQMMFTGIKVDHILLARETKRVEKEIQDLSSWCDELITEIWDEPINVKSPKQLIELFYVPYLGFRFQPKYTGSGPNKKVTTNRKALEALAAEHYICRPIVKAILAYKDASKSLEFLKRGVESDGRVHCTFNVAATETGRWSSSKNPWGRGANFQNQDEKTRSIYIADKGCCFAYPDLKSAESYGVAYYSGDAAYIRAVSSSDVHTAAAKFIWPELDWPNDNGQEDRAYAEEPFYRHFTRRDISKRGGHAYNYLGTPWTVATHLNVSQHIAEEFQERYFNAFPGIRTWHATVQQMLQDTGILTTPLGRERMFFGRLSDRETLKEAIAFLPQSLISDILKLGFLRVFNKFSKDLKLLGDLHDGVVMSIPTKSLDNLVPQIKDLLEIPIKMPHGIMTIPVDFTIGYKWQKKEMAKWTKNVLSILTRPETVDNLLDIPAELV
jgi:DNA polymerase-1